MQPHTKRYFYYLHNSEVFNKERDLYRRATKAGKVHETKKLLSELREKYEIPKHALKDFLLLLLKEPDPFTSVGMDITRDGETRNLKVTGPAITMTVYTRLSKPQFEALWETYNYYQEYEIEELKLPANLGDAFKKFIDIRAHRDFDEAFEIYKLKKSNPEMTYCEILEETSNKLLYMRNEKTAESKARFIRNLIESMNSETKAGGA